MRRFAIIVVAFLTTVYPALARALTDAEKQSLVDTVAAYAKSIENHDVGFVTTVMSPKILQALADRSKMSVGQVKAIIVRQIIEASSKAKLVSSQMDMEHASYPQTQDGTPYVLIPTVTIIESADNRQFRSTTEMIAIEDDAKWYFVQVGDKVAVEVFKTVYPSFADVTFAPNKIVQTRQ